MKIEQLILQSNDLAGTKNFYQNTLGLTVSQQPDGELKVRAGLTDIVFRQAEAGKPFYHFAFNIPDNKIEEALNWCHQQNIQTISYEDTEVVDFPNWNAESLYFWDNNGNILEFISRRDLNNSSSITFGPEQILCVSEIGIVADNVPYFCGQLIYNYGVSYYEKQSPTGTFSVIGDAKGLLIIVPPKRNWFPTNVASGQYPVEVSFTNNGKSYNLKV